MSTSLRRPVFCWSRSSSAQEINIAIGLGGRPAPVTIFDEIEDARERAAFRELWDAAPQSQMDLAIRFVDQYPRSIVLREAYELAARAFVAAGDLAQGLTGQGGHCD